MTPAERKKIYFMIIAVWLMILALLFNVIVARLVSSALIVITFFGFLLDRKAGRQ